MIEAMMIMSQDERWWALLVVSLVLCSHHNKNCGSVMRAEARTKAQPTWTTTSLTLGQCSSSWLPSTATTKEGCYAQNFFCLLISR